MDIDKLQELIDSGRDSPMLRLTLARLLAERDEASAAVSHLQSATRQDPAYTAAWKELGRLHRLLGDDDSAREAWRRGIEAARKNGDKQAQKEMTVFLRRLAT